MAEGDHAAITDDEIEAGGGQRKDQQARGEADVVILAERLQGKRQGGSDKEQGDFQSDAVTMNVHARDGNSPCGSQNRMPAISR